MEPNLEVGYENAKVAVLDMTSLSVLFFSDSVSVGSSPLVTLTAKSFVHSDGPLHLKKVSTAISMYVIENNNPFSGIISKQTESSKDGAASNEPSQEMTHCDLCDTVPFLENDPPGNTLRSALSYFAAKIQYALMLQNL
ncbi:hypothetical protein HAX54_012028 [Datura stramonium]|uniref:Uncharacterized protein n=1 Tax=Datura stramonium TaxID=4076 RepID=A0ABS8TKQ7_DATST|nr:hypothetical protein [Datura stramonium]